MRKSTGRWIAALAAGGVWLTAAPPAPAQTQTQTQTQAGGLDEIIVTARKRDESLQSVPITLNVFTAQTIQSAGIESPRDFIAMVPNMTLVETQNIGNSFITIRGISQARNSEPSVAVLVDGVLETQSVRVHPGAVRHPADRGAERVRRAPCTAATRSAERSSSTPRNRAIISKAARGWEWVTGRLRKSRLPSADRSIRRGRCAIAPR